MWTQNVNVQRLNMHDGPNESSSTETHVAPSYTSICDFVHVCLTTGQTLQ